MISFDEGSIYCTSYLIGIHSFAPGSLHLSYQHQYARLLADQLSWMLFEFLRCVGRNFQRFPLSPNNFGIHHHALVHSEIENMLSMQNKGKQINQFKFTWNINRKCLNRTDEMLDFLLSGLERAIWSPLHPWHSKQTIVFFVG